MGTQVHCNNTMSAFSALHLLRSYNHLLGPTTIESPHTYHPLLSASIRDISPATRPPESGVTTSPPYTPFQATSAATTAAFMTPPSLLGTFPPYPHLLPVIAAEAKTNPLLSRALSSIGSPPKRPRGEKKPIPDDQKDEKYFERRKRNNQAAKKSRDARKIREDQIALRATVLEHENAVLRAQVLTLREETQSLRHLLLQRKNGVEDIPHLQPLAS